MVQNVQLQIFIFFSTLNYQNGPPLMEIIIISLAPGLLPPLAGLARERSTGCQAERRRVVFDS